MIAELVHTWREEAELYRRRGLEDAAKLTDSLADELEAHVRGLRNETVTLTEAAEMSGYTADYLGKLIRRGHLPNAGRKNAPRLYLTDVPRRVGCDAPEPDVPVVSLHPGRSERGLEADRDGGRVRVQRRGDAP